MASLFNDAIRGLENRLDQKLNRMERKIDEVKQSVVQLNLKVMALDLKMVALYVVYTEWNHVSVASVIDRQTVCVR